MIQGITSINDAINGVVWGWPALILLGAVAAGHEMHKELCRPETPWQEYHTDAVHVSGYSGDAGEGDPRSENRRRRGIICGIESDTPGCTSEGIGSPVLTFAGMAAPIAAASYPMARIWAETGNRQASWCF